MYAAVSLFPYDGGTYVQAPFEEIGECEYSKLRDVWSVSNFDLTNVLEYQDDTALQGEIACAGGSCEI